MPLPHTCTTGVTATASETVEFAVTSSACVTLPTSSVLEPSATESTTKASAASRRRRAPLTLTVDAFTLMKGCGPMCAGSPGQEADQPLAVGTALRLEDLDLAHRLERHQRGRHGSGARVDRHHPAGGAAELERELACGDSGGIAGRWRRDGGEIAGG
eukprot:scaffold10311_cov55-Phaeocystis_antarctica.AAC.1